MEIVVKTEFVVNIEGDRTNGNEIFYSVSECLKEVGQRLLVSILKGYQERMVELLCSEDRKAKAGLGRHEEKGRKGELCLGRKFRRAGYWSQEKYLHGECGSVSFRPALVECMKCGKRLTPLLEALELERNRSHTEQLLQLATEAVAETSYRRGAEQLKRLGDIPIPKSTLHRWVASIEMPLNKVRGDPFLAVDGTGFKQQPGKRGKVRMVLEMGREGRIHPLGVWAGTEWKDIASELREHLKGEPQMLVSDGELALEKWFSRLTKMSMRCHWHLVRDCRHMLWQNKVPLVEIRKQQRRLGELLSIEIPEEDVELLSDEDRNNFETTIRGAEAELASLEKEFLDKGYEKAAGYLANARGKLFSHLRLWLETGLVGPRTTSIVENTIRELVRRLKKVGWNWSDKGATRMGRIIMIRRYDQDAWDSFWRKRMNIKDRCKITITHWQSKAIA